MNRIIKNTSMLYLLTIAKMLFPLITLPYLTRVLSVPAYGVVAYVKAVMQYMQLFVDFGFLLSGTKDIALLAGNKEETNRQISSIFFARFILLLFSSLILAVMICFIPLLKSNTLFTILSFIVVGLTVFLMDFYYRGIEKMEFITIRFVMMKTIATALTFVLVRSDRDLLWIPLLDIIGSVIAVGWIWLSLYKNGIRIVSVKLSEAIQKLKDSAVYFASDFATTAFNALNTVLIGIFITPTEVAYWSLCMQLIGAVQSLYTPIINGIYPQMVKTRNIYIVKRSLTIFMPVVIAGCVITFFVSKYVLLAVGGAKYLDATYLLRLLIPVLLFSFPGMLFGWPTLGAINRQKETTITTVSAAVFQVIVLVILIISNCFTLFTIAVLRGVTELLMFVLRYCFYHKYKFEFSNERKV